MTLSQQSSHFVCAIIWRRGEKGIEFLVVDSVSTDENGLKSSVQTKFPGGMNRIPEESVDLTLRREILEETHLAILPDSCRRIWERQVAADHTKYAYLVPYDGCRGELRKEHLHEQGDDLEPPYWVPVDELKYKLFDKHQPQFLAACHELGIL